MWLASLWVFSVGRAVVRRIAFQMLIFSAVGLQILVEPFLEARAVLKKPIWGYELALTVNSR